MSVLHLFLSLCLVSGQFGQLKSQVCARQRCNQLISGRNLRYNRALRIVQSEEYLSAADLSILRRRSKRDSSGDYIGFLDLFNNKDTTLALLCSYPNTPSLFEPSCNYFASECIGSGKCQYNNIFTGKPYILSSSSFQASYTDCITYSMTQYKLLCYSTSTPSSAVVSSTTSRNEMLDDAMEAARLAGLGGAVYSGAVLTMNPTYPLVNGQATPPGSPVPGTPLGGGLPSGGLPGALALVPLGLIPVATFPPFATPRTFPAEAVIFSEIPQINRIRRMGKRSTHSQRSVVHWIYKWLNAIILKRNDHSPSSDALYKFVDLLMKIKRKLKKLNKNMKCLRTRLYARTHPKQIEMMKKMTLQSNGSRASYESEREEDLDDEVNSIDDCIDGMSEPMYGFRVNVTLIEDEMCILGQTCNNVAGFDSTLSSRQSGEEFSSEAPPECRVSLC